MADPDLVRILQSQRISEQEIQNFSFDTEFGILAVEIAGYDVSTDAIKRVSVDTQGRLQVVIVGESPTTSVFEYAEALTIADNALTTILTHTVVTADLLLDKILASGTVDAEYRIVVNGSTKAKYITSEQDRTAKFDFPVAQKFAIGDVIDIKVVHFNTSVTADFNTSLIGHK